MYFNTLGIALRTSLEQGQQVLLQWSDEICIGRRQQLRGEWPAGGFDHLQSFSVVQLRCGNRVHEG